MRPSIEVQPELELKELLSHLKYAFLGENDTLLVIRAPGLQERQIKVLWKHVKAIGWTLIILWTFYQEYAPTKLSLLRAAKPIVNQHQLKRYYTIGSQEGNNNG